MISVTTINYSLSCAKIFIIAITYIVQFIAGYSGIWSSLSGLVGSKPLNRKDIEPLISKMQDHLMAKNVAADVAKNICDSVTNKLEGKICGTVFLIVYINISFCNII